MSRSNRTLCFSFSALIFISSMLFSCSSRPPLDDHSAEYEYVYPVVAYNSDHDDHVLVTGKPVARWLTLNGQRVRAITGSDDFQVGIRQESRLSGKITAQTGCSRNVPRGLTINFRILFRDEHTGEVQSLFNRQQARTDRDFSAVEITLPESLPEQGWIIFSVQLEGEKITDRGEFSAYWIEPRIKRKERRQLPTDKRSGNVLIITLDTTRQDVLGCYGGEARTPNLDRLSRSGVLFRQAYTVAGGTAPSHASLLTSLYPLQHQVYTNRDILRDKLMRIPEIFQHYGYRTAGFVSARPVIRGLGFDRGFDYFDDAFLFDDKSGLFSHSESQRRAELTINHFLEWHAIKASTPFFAWIHVFDPHQPYSPPIRYNGSETQTRDSAKHFDRYFQYPTGKPKRLTHKQVASIPVDQRILLDQASRNRYYGEVNYVDYHLGRVITALRKADQFNQSQIIVVADHGENFLTRGPSMAYGHRGLYYDVTRLPFLFKLPGSRRAGSITDVLLGNMDISPTILDVAGLPAPDSWLGKSFIPWLEGTSHSAFRPFIITESANRLEIAVRTTKTLYRELVRTNSNNREKKVSPQIRRRLGYDEAIPSQLYFLDSDPSESKNLIEKSNGDDLESLSVILEDFRAQEHSPARSLVSEKHIQALEALGYIE